MQLLCSTGAFSRSPDYIDYHAALRYGPQLDIDGLELMFYTTWYDQIDTIGHALQASGLNFPVIHAEKSIGVFLGKADLAEREKGVQWLAENCRLAHLVGARILVLHLWGWPELDDHLENNLSSFGQCLDIAQSYGQTIAIETIPCRLSNPLSNVKRSLERDRRCRVTLDTEFLAQAGQLEEVFTVPWLWTSNYVQHTHIKDFDGQLFSPEGKRRYLHPGEGIIDYPRFFAELKRHQYESYISLESPTIDAYGEVDIEKLQNSLHMVRKWMESK